MKRVTVNANIIITLPEDCTDIKKAVAEVEQTLNGICVFEDGNMVLRFHFLEKKKPDVAVGAIIYRHLKDHGYDGLYGDECGCDKDDLFPCEHPDMDFCHPAHETKCQGMDKCPYSKECPEPHVGNVCMTTKKPKPMTKKLRNYLVNLLT